MAESAIHARLGDIIFQNVSTFVYPDDVDDAVDQILVEFDVLYKGG